MRRGLLIATVVVTIALVALAGLAIAWAGGGQPLPPMQLDASSFEDSDESQPEPRRGRGGRGPSPSASAPTSSAAPTTSGIGQAQAEAAATQAVGGGTAVFSHLDRDDGFTVWDVRVEGRDGAYDVEVDAATGEIAGFDHDDDGRAPAAGDPTVDRTAAEAAAVEAVGGGDAVASHLDRDDGVPEWEIAVAGRDGALYEVVVDAVDGTVREVDRDD